MRKILLFALFAAPLSGFGQNCSGCTQTISTNTTANFTVTAGTTLCIQQGVTLTGNLILNGGTVCNDGTQLGDILLQSGTYNNYGLIQDTSSGIVQNGGFFNNYGTVDAATYSTNGAGFIFINTGVFNVSAFSIDWAVGAPRPSGVNYGTLNSVNMIVDSCDFDNHGTINLSGNLSVSSSAMFNNYGPIFLDGNFLNSSTAYFNNACTVSVGGNWSNSGTITGTLSNCGNFTVGGFAVNFASGQLATDNSYVDVCEQGNPNGLSNNGTMGVNVTQCACTSACLTTGITAPVPASVIRIYPNPVIHGNPIVIQAATPADHVLRVFSLTGARVAALTFSGTRLDWPAPGLAPGVYIMELDGRREKLVVVQ